MNLIKVKDYDEMSKTLNDLFVEQIRKNPNSVVSFTTGGTPKKMAELFVNEILNGLDIKNVVMINLDEYVGKKDGAYSVYKWMNDNIYSKINQKPKDIFIFDAEALNKNDEIKRFEEILNKYPRDIQMLGLGINGHIGANEPFTSFDSKLFVADSCETTIKSTMELFNMTYEQTPKQMFTMGFKEIMEAKCVVLAASGKTKANAVKNIIEGEIDESIPASYLKNHKNFIFIIDEDAASLLE